MNILLYFSVPRNIVAYIHRCYISRLFRRLTEEYKLRSLVIEVRSSVITEERILVSYSGCFLATVIL
jgi:hypothetical protein